MNKDGESIFSGALERRTPQERKAFLDEACGSDAELRRSLDSLLAAHDAGSGSPDTSHPPLITTEALRQIAGLQDQSSPAAMPECGTMIGPYRLVEQIGEGGMGVVYMAEQLRPVRRRVALKIIKPGLDTRQVIARFEAERQALAMMDHPNIARVFDAGVTDAGRSYFVMELVHGVPLTEYCDQHQLNPRQRLELFVQICSAVQHAHIKGIIHRDLKPSNVLVMQSDDKPVPKIIDFGIAKATAGQRLTDHTLLTQFRELIGTPLYMSPEQAEMSAVMDVDTRSDVYSLGVMLYELLTGTTPFDRERLAKAEYDEVRRIIREEEPPRPSTRLSKLGETLITVSSRRHVDPRRLRQLVRGDLDRIVMKALEKDRTRRYATAEGLARDVHRYLNDQPVEACTPSRMYRLRKFARRNRAALLTGTTIAAVLVAATAVSTWQAVRAVAERRRADEHSAVAKAVNDFVNSDLLGQAEPGNQSTRGAPPNPDLKVREALDRASDRIGGRFTGRPLVEAGVHHAIGSAYLSLSDRPKAEPHVKQALDLRTSLLGEENPETLETLALLGRLYAEREARRAEELLLRALDGCKRVLGPRHRQTLQTQNWLADMYADKGDPAKAIQVYLDALSNTRAALGEADPLTLQTLSSLGAAYHAAGKPQEAEALFKQILAEQRRTLAERDPATMLTQERLGWLLAEHGRFEEGERLLLEVLAWKRTALPEGDPFTAWNLRSLSMLYASVGRSEEAAKYSREEIALRAKKAKLLSSDLFRIVKAMANLADAARKEGRLANAADLFQQVFLLQKKLGDDPHGLSQTLAKYGLTLDAMGKLPEAEAVWRENIQLREQSDLPDSEPVCTARCRLGMNLVRQGRYADAEIVLQNAYDRRQPGKPDLITQHDLMDFLIQMYDAWGKPEQAASWRRKLAETVPVQVLLDRAKVLAGERKWAESQKFYVEALARQRESAKPLDVAQTLYELAYVQRGLKQPDESERSCQEALQIRQQTLDSGDIRIAQTMSALGAALADQGKFDQAERMLLGAHKGMASAAPAPADYAQTIQEIVDLYNKSGKPDAAAEWRAKLPVTQPATRPSN